MRIAVTEGVVAVGPIGEAPFELIAPSSATVTLDGLRADQAAPSVVGAAPVVTSRSAEAPLASSAPGKEKAKTPVTATTRTSSADVDRMVASVQECFGEHTVSRGDLRVTVLTRMSLHVQAETVGLAQQSPTRPSTWLPAVRTCVDEAVAQTRLAPSDAGFSVGRVLELER